MATLRRSIVASVLFTVFGGPAILLVLVPWWITRFRLPAGESAAQRFAGGVLIVSGTAPLLESIVRFIVVGRGALVPGVPTKHLVVSGLYRFVRNPMYLGVLAALAGESVLFLSRGLILEWIAVFAATHSFVLLYEEPKLTRTFGEQYIEYRRHVPRWVPRLTPWNAAGTRAR